MSIQHPFVALTQKQDNALIGSLLGDGHLCKEHVNAYFVVARSYLDINYLKYEMSIFDNFLSNSFYHNNVLDPFIYNSISELPSAQG